MFNFFIALFGGLFYAGKYLSERNRVTGIQRRNADIDQIRGIIMCNSYNSNIKLEPPQTTAERWTMAESIEEDLRFIFGKRWRQFLINSERFHNIGRPARRNESCFDNPWQIAYEVWVSSKGYIDAEVRLSIKYSIYALSFGIDAKPKQCGEPWCPEPMVDETEGRNIRLRACQVIERNLQTKHSELSKDLRLLQYNAPNDGSSQAYDKTLVWAFDILGEYAVRIW